MSQSVSPKSAKASIPSAGQLQSSADFVSTFLTRFLSRQSFLQTIRAISVSIVAMLLGVCLCVGIDWSVQPPEAWRWLFTCTVYAGTLVVVWQLGLRNLLFPPSHEQAARAVEQALPSLQESLLAAVELRDQDGVTRSGSPIFIDAIERSVVHELEKSEINLLLPWRLVLKSLLSVIAVLGLILIACGLPNARLPQWMARSMIPFVSLERPSNTQIEVLEPALDALSVPSDQTVQFAIAVSGRIPREATLELIEMESNDVVLDTSKRRIEKRRSLPMIADIGTPEKFLIAAPISDRATKFRILAGDAETIFRVLQPVAPPTVIAFHSEVEPPSYTFQPKESRSNPRGDMQVIKGSTVRLQLDVSQVVSKANIVMEYQASGRMETIELSQIKPEKANPLSPKSMLRLTAEFPVHEDALYQVKLVSEFSYKGNKIENTFSPRYRIDALQDTAPIIAWKTSEKTTWRESPTANQVFMVSPDEIVSLSVNVSDNLPVDKIFHEASINTGPWATVQTDLQRSEWSQDVSVKSNDAVSRIFAADSTWSWDLVSLSANSGDSFATRVTAIDRKGNTAHSPTVQLSLASVGFDRERHRNLYHRAELVPLLQALATSINMSRDTLRPQLERLKDVANPAEDRTRIINDVREIVMSSVKSAQAVRAKAEQIMKGLGRCVDQADVELVVRLVARVERDWLANITFGIEADLPSAKAKPDAKSVEWHRREFEQRMTRLLQSYDQACDNSKRCTDIYRQWIGHELQASLTSDLTRLRDHQQSVLNRKPIADFTILSRSQQLAEQYFRAIEKLVEDIEPKLNQDFRNRLPELTRWIDRTRTEIKDLAQSTEKESATQDLRSRIAQSVAELKSVHWAFDLQRNLASDGINGRKELLTRSSVLWSHFERFFDRHRRRAEAIKDKSMPTDELQNRFDEIARDVIGPILSAMNQMIDRRDLHQQRIFSDPLFASDMGMAHRAWMSVLERWVSEPNSANEVFQDAQLIAKAYQILESVHETVQARLVVQSLLPVERYEWRTLEGQLMNPKQWDSISVRLEVATQWMREAGFPNSITEKYNALRGCEPAQKISAKLNPRRESNNSNLVSCADEIRSFLTLWSDADREAKPILDNARAILAKFSPTISDLAKQAVDATQKLRTRTEQLNPKRIDPKKDNLASESRGVSTETKIQQERSVADNRISQLQDALVELANKQDLLSEAELNAARDSDNSLKLLDSVVPSMDEAIENALESVDQVAEDRTERIDEALRRESKTVEALERIANHFAMREANQNEDSAGPDLAQSSAELAKLASASAREYALMPKAMPLHDDSNDYQRAKELAELVNSEPESLLQKLESELKRNPLMRSELSEISLANAQSLANELQNASKVEEAMAKQLESDDVKLAGEKRVMLNQLRAIADWSEQIVARLLDNAAQAAKRSDDKDAATASEKSAADLRRIAQSIRQWNEDTLASDISMIAPGLETSLERLKKQIGTVNNTIQPKMAQAIGRDEKQRQVIQNETRNIQNQSRNELLHQAREFVAQSQRQLDQTKKRLQQSQSELDNAGKQRLAVQRSFDKEPKNPTILESLKQVSIRSEQAFLKKGAEEQLVIQSQALLEQAKSQVASFESAERSSLDHPNPRAAFAVEQLSIAEKQLAQLQEQVMSMFEPSQELSQPQTTAATLSRKEREQQKVQETVSDVSSQLERSGRHEKRLGNEEGAGKLASLAEGVETVSRGSLSRAKESLSYSAAAAEQTEREQSDGSKLIEIKERFQRPETNVSRDLLNSAASELANQSMQLQQQIGSIAASQQAQSDKRTPVGENSSFVRDATQAEARNMARMLDGLDRQLHSNSSASKKPSASESDSNTRPPSESSSDTTSSNGQKSKNADGDQDRNGSRSTFKDSVISSAEKLAGAMGQDRSNQREARRSQKNSSKQRPGKSTGGGQPGGELSVYENGGNFVLPGMTRVPNGDWGKLRAQRAEDAVEGRRDDFDPEFSDAIRAYYKALGNR